VANISAPGTQNILNVPLIWQPSLQPARSVPFGFGPTTFSSVAHRCSAERATRVPDTAVRGLQFWRGKVCQYYSHCYRELAHCRQQRMHPADVALGAYYKAPRSQVGSTCQLRTQITLIFW